MNVCIWKMHVYPVKQMYTWGKWTNQRAMMSACSVSEERCSLSEQRFAPKLCKMTVQILAENQSSDHHRSSDSGPECHMPCHMPKMPCHMAKMPCHTPCHMAKMLSHMPCHTAKMPCHTVKKTCHTPRKCHTFN